VPLVEGARTVSADSSSGATVTIRVVLADGSSATKSDLNPSVRTVVADTSSLLDTISATLTLDGPSAVAFDASAAVGSTLSFTNLRPGTWELKVNGYKDGVQVATGTAINIVTTMGGSDPLPVEVTLSPTNGMGALALTLSIPTGVDCDHVRGLISGGGLNNAIQTINPGGDSVTIGGTGINAGSYTMDIEFWKGYPGDGTSILIATFKEAVNIWLGKTADKWIASDGTPQTTRNFTLAEFKEADSKLTSVIIQSGTQSEPFDLISSSDTTFNASGLSGSAIRFSTVANSQGQTLKYTWAGEPPTSIPSGVLSPALSFTDAVSNTLTIEVTSADGVHSTTYTFTCKRAYTITYDANGGISVKTGTDKGDPGFPVAGDPYTILSPTHDSLQLTYYQDGFNWRFAGWATTRSGPVNTDYDPNDTINNVTSNITLYAQWTPIRATGPAGGIVFYDKGNYDKGWRYLEAAPAGWIGNNSENNGKTMGWTAATTLSGSSTVDNTLGGGKFNSLMVETRPLFTDTVSAVCLKYSNAGYADWFLGSKDDVAEMLTVLASTYIDSNTYGFTWQGTYWTSSYTPSESKAYAVTHNGTSANPITPSFGQPYRLRPIRAFANGKQTWMVLYEPNADNWNGAVPVDTQFYSDGESALIRGNTGSLLSTDSSGLAFKGWSLVKDPPATYVTVGAPRQLNDDLILHAVWQ
jgi:uncharacterized repeat protein (TIGR02543 family)